MVKIVSIVGATGAQGKGVVSAFKNDPEYHVRAITRNPQSTASQTLSSQGIEVVKADADDLESLKSAFAGSHIIFGVTNFFEPFAASGPEKALEVEAQQGINLARAAAATETLEHYIWSTLPDAKTISGGKYVVPHFDGKNRVDEYIRSDSELLRKTTFFWVTFYHSNFVFPMLKPYWIPTADKYVQFASYAPDTPINTIGDVSVNVAPFVRAVVSQPEKTRNGAIVLASLQTMTAADLLQTWARVKGTKAQVVRIDGKTYRDLWPISGEEIGVMMEFWDEYRERSWDAAGHKLLTKEDLGVTGLQSLEESFKTFELE